MQIPKNSTSFINNSKTHYLPVNLRSSFFSNKQSYMHSDMLKNQLQNKIVREQAFFSRCHRTTLYRSFDYFKQQCVAYLFIDVTTMTFHYVEQLYG
ncbi:hypothetical protein DFR56_10682 [Pseudogracilibacillus auburnensis]|uniref:Uncharacterized protein n=1 Tax=Pseudogracilibacillus auburnensis TaxID=1494959 RepID=A0A2V3W1F3_9BACI|nr:hypothetical protein DFR56_10682 [Pseudogracilibacillus auburnensis]